jgi:hypothetical protein
MEVFMLIANPIYLFGFRGLMKNIIFLFLLGFVMNLSAQEEPIENTKDKPALVETDSYRSPYKQKLPGVFLQSQLLNPDDRRHLETGGFWIQDQLRMGIAVRPRFESRQNKDFNSTTSDYTNFTTNVTQLWFVADPSEYFSLKVSVQDARLWGGSQTPDAVGQDPSRFGLANNVVSPSVDPSGKTIARNIGNRTDIREAFVLLKKTGIEGLQFQMGRQVLVYGDQRIFGGRNWLANGNSMDGVRMFWENKNYKFHFFGMSLSEESDSANGVSSLAGRKNYNGVDDAYLTGTYNTFRLSDNFLFDIYLTGVHQKWIKNTNSLGSAYASSVTTGKPIDSIDYVLTNPDSSKDRLRQRDDLYTAGFRITNRVENNLPVGVDGLDWTFETAIQRGDTGKRVETFTQTTFNDVTNHLYNPYYNPGQGNKGIRLQESQVQYHSYFAVAQVGYTFPQQIRLGFQYQIASGDPNRTDSKEATFQPLFSLRHGTFPYWNSVNGMAEMSGIRNLSSYSMNLSINTETMGRYMLAFYDVSKAEVKDGWYAPSGLLQTGASGTTESYSNNRYSITDGVGNLGKRLYRELDFIYIKPLAGGISLWVGAAYLHAGNAIKNQRDRIQIDPKNNSVKKFSDFQSVSRFYYVMVTTTL